MRLLPHESLQGGSGIGAEVLVPLHDVQRAATLPEQGAQFVNPKGLRGPQCFQRFGRKQRHPGPESPPAPRSRPSHDAVARSMLGGNQTLRLQLHERVPEGTAADLQLLAQRTLGRQPVAPLPGGQRLLQAGDRLGHQGLALGNAVHGSATGGARRERARQGLPAPAARPGRTLKGR